MNIQIKAITQFLETLAPLSYQENYDNAGLITGNPNETVTKILVTLDSTEEVVDEAIQKGCNLIIAHHPIIFGGIKKLNGKNYVERTVIKAIKHDIAIYAIHTNLDNVHTGVNQKICNKLGLEKAQILAPTTGKLKKISVFVPVSHLEPVRKALFDSGCGQIGAYSECSFGVEGTGTFKAGENTNPFIGTVGKQQHENEIRLETVFPGHLQQHVVSALTKAHPYEEVAFDIYPIDNQHNQVGAGMIGTLPKPLSPDDFLKHVQTSMSTNTIRYTRPSLSEIRKVAVCGGAGSFLIKQAITSGADAFVTSDVKYHEFFDAENRLMIADIGHYESEIFTKELLRDTIIEKFTTFAVLLSETNTNPINYFNS